MNWMNIRTEALRGPKFSAAEPAHLGVWLRVLAYCCEQENGGVIAGAKLWTDRQWMTACGVTQAEVLACSLILFGETQAETQATVLNYPSEKEFEVKENREAGRVGGLAKTQAKTQAARENGKKGGRPKTQAETQAETQRNPSETQGNGKENGIGKEGEEEQESEGKENPPSRPKNFPTTDAAKRIHALFGRRESTAWTDAEVKAYKKIGEINLDDLAAIEAYYAKERAKKEMGIHRRDLLTFLNNYQGELDRARSPNGSGVTDRRQPVKRGLQPEDVDLSEGW